MTAISQHKEAVNYFVNIDLKCKTGEPGVQVYKTTFGIKYPAAGTYK